ncbi:prephenate dehydrogenase [Paenisporosarcina antarctica]|uniref:Prephenate dehydrogenase n=1 Tax=Paenisporosarcina antarctica TaxID=417367 RepID=A0A4P6ZXY4_9BACL|nr:prephenate dehydrogenase [Paenisporosarcina antarctica]QBP41331.1 prephenate dehydrogenase [Paenisporosarcina antarctica]
MTTHVLIVGLGLIGGSLALAIQKNPEVNVIGFDADSHTVRKAKKLGVIDDMAFNLEESAALADVIIFATPVNATIQLMNEVQNWQLKKGVILSDTGSTKKMIMEKAKSLKEIGLTFIGGHPMAGSHKSGIEAAKAHLFENAYYIITPVEHEDEIQIRTLEAILQPTKGKILRINAREHDHMTAVVSHFPHLVAASLVHQLSSENEEYPFTRQLAAGGFRDITRIASSNPIMWRDITIQNRLELVKQLDNWQSEMDTVKTMLMEAKSENIEHYFTRAKFVRDELPITSQGAMYSVFDLHIDVPDYPGVISEVTGLLAKHLISITNLRIVETREDVFGILVISFQTTEDRERAAISIQQETTYETYIS